MKKKTVVKRKKKRSGLFAALVLFGVLGVTCFYGYTAVGYTSVETATVKAGDIWETVSETGTATARNVCTILAKSSFEVASLSVKVGDTVRKGELILTAAKEATQPTDQGVLEAQLSGVRAQLAQAQEQAMTLWGLFEDGVISWKQYEEAATAVTVLESQESSLNEAIKEASAPAPKLDNDVTAPFTGVITELRVSEGDTAVVGRPLVQITDTSDIYIEAGILESDASNIDVGSRVMLKGLDGAESVVTAVAPKVRQSVSDLGTVQKRKMVDIMIPPGMESALGADVEFDIVVAEAKNVVLAPWKAIFQMAEKEYVFLVQNEKAVLREVVTGLKDERYFEILSGLSAGDMVIVSPSASLTDGSKVQF